MSQNFLRFSLIVGSLLHIMQAFVSGAVGNTKINLALNACGHVMGKVRYTRGFQYAVQSSQGHSEGSRGSTCLPVRLLGVFWANMALELVFELCSCMDNVMS